MAGAPEAHQEKTGFGFRSGALSSVETLAQFTSTISPTSASGARTSAYSGPAGKLNSFYLAVSARADREAELWVDETRE